MPKTTQLVNVMTFEPRQPASRSLALTGSHPAQPTFSYSHVVLAGIRRQEHWSRTCFSKKTPSRGPEPLPPAGPDPSSMGTVSAGPALASHLALRELSLSWVELPVLRKSPASPRLSADPDTVHPPPPTPLPDTGHGHILMHKQACPHSPGLLHWRSVLPSPHQEKTSKEKGRESSHWE